MVAAMDQAGREAWRAGPAGAEWRCEGCGRLLGVVAGASLVITFRERNKRGRRIVASLPATQQCPDCGTVSRRDLDNAPRAR